MAKTVLKAPAIVEKEELAPTSEFFSFVKRGIMNLENNLTTPSTIFINQVDAGFEDYLFMTRAIMYKKKLKERENNGG